MRIPAPTNVRDYAKSRGWTLLQDALRERLYVFSNPQHGLRQLIFPMDSTAPDYAESVLSVAEKLAVFESVPVDNLVAKLLGVRDDTLRLRITTPWDIASLPLSFATDAVAATQKLVLAGASSVLRPQVHHPRLNRAEAKQLLNAARFQHTEQGSFVLKVSCSYDGLDIPAVDNVPFVRSTMLTILHGARELVEAIEIDNLDGFVDTALNDPSPVVSSNLCEALTHLHNSELHNALEVSVDWSAISPLPNQVGSVVIQTDYFPRIEEVQRALRDTSVGLEDTFMGTVEELNGEMGRDGRRSGLVILNLLIDDQVVRAQINLTADQYVLADRIHMTDGAYAIVAGRLRPGNQPRLLTDVTRFESQLPRNLLNAPREN